MTCRFTFVSRAAVLSAAMFVLASPIAAAQTPAPAPGAADGQGSALGTPAFARLVKGKHVWITTADGARHKDLVVALSPTGLTVNAVRQNGGSIRGAIREVPFDQVVKVQKVTHHVGNGALIGLGAGAGLGVLAWVSSAASEDGEGFFVVPLWTGIGVGAGAAIGALLNSNNGERDVLYDAKRRTTTTMTLAPILSPTRKGVAVSMTWR